MGGWVGGWAGGFGSRFSNVWEFSNSGVYLGFWV